MDLACYGNEQAARRIRPVLFRILLGIMTPGKLLDLGTGHGGFALAAHEMGWDVTAVDARTQRMPMTDGIEWIQADVRAFPVEGYDCVAILGLLYHLELADQLDILRRCAPTPTIADTHVSLDPDYKQGDYEGHLVDELAGRTVAEHRRCGTASWGNLVAFYPTEESLLRMFQDCGYTATYKLSPPYLEDRTFYLCL